MSTNNLKNQRHEPSNHTKRLRNRLYAFTLAILTAASAWFSTVNELPAPPVAPPDTSNMTETPQALSWNYPTRTYSIEIDDFSLALDGSFIIRNDYAPGGLSSGYLENCMKLEPAVPFTVESIGEGVFRIVLEGGKSLSETRVTLPGDPSVSPVPEPFTALIKPHLALRVTTEKGNGGAPIDLPFSIEFSLPMDFSGDLQSLITFSPALPCTIEQSAEHTLSVTPNEMMPYGTTYSITVSPLLKAMSGEAFADEQMLELMTESHDFSLVITNQGVSTTPPTEEIKAEFQLDTAGRGGRNGQVTLLTFDASTAGAFDTYLAYLQSVPQQMMGYGKYSENPMSTPNDTGTLPTNLKELETWDGTFPEGLSSVSFKNPGQGFYFLRTTLYDTKTKQPLVWYKPVQVTTPSIYLQSTLGKNVLWLNDSATGAPLANHTVSFLRSDFDEPLASVNTDRDGVAMLTLPLPRWEEEYTEEETAQKRYWSSLEPNNAVAMTPEEANRRNLLSNVFAVYDASGQPVYADSTVSLTTSDSPENRYYSFFYLDRALYRPTDEIQFWGYLKPHARNTAPAPQKLTVRLDPDNLDQRVEVTVAPDGSYSGVIALDKIASSEYAVTVEYALSQKERDDYAAAYRSESTTRTLEYKWIQVNEFQKAAYTIAAEVDRPLYRWGDEIAVTITPTFFDGTPAPNMPLECSVFNPGTGNLDAIVNLQTDAEGKAVYRFKAGDCLTFENSLDWTPKQAYFYVRIVSEGENITYQGHYNYLPGDYAIRPTVEMVGDTDARLVLLVNKITLDNIKTTDDLEGIVGDNYFLDDVTEKYDLLLGDPADVTMDVKISIDYCRPFDGSYDESFYDYADKERTLSVEVKGGKAVVEKLVDVACREKTYLSVSAQASYKAAGCTVAYSHSAHNQIERYYSSETTQPKGYAFNVYRNRETTPIQVRESYMLRDMLEADVGDTLRFALTKDGQELPSQNGKLLYTLIQRDVIEHGVLSQPLTLTQKQSYANGVLLIAAYFDGKAVHPVVNCQIDVAKKSLQLNIETTADKEAYLPGDTATVTAKVTDKNGNPVAANLCLSIVDEAVFALREQSFDLISELYGGMDFYLAIVNKYTTGTGDIDPFGSGGDGGKGDGDNLLAYDIFRKNFKDTALFLPTRSNADGIATATLTMPDNLTSWRVTTVAVDNMQQGGQNRSAIITSLPFFIKPVISSKYIAGDEIALSLRGHGTALTADDPVSYSVTLSGNGTENTQNYEKKAGDMLTVNFGILPEGDYTVTATGKFGERSDTVQLPLSVIHSNLELTVHQEIDLQKPLALPNSRYPVTITFYNRAFESYYNCLSVLLQHHCQRLDQRMARFVSAQELARIASDTLPSNLRTEDDFGTYQRADGGIGWNPEDYGWESDGSDPILTVKAFLVARDQFSEARVRRYLLQTAEDSTVKPVEQAAAWTGLAAIDPSYADTLRQRLENTTVLSEQLWYAIGLAYAEDYATASRFYEEVIIPKLDTRGEVLRLSGAKRTDELEIQTALAWALATKLDLEEADKFADYFSHQGWMGAALFEAMLYVQHAPTAPSPIRFSYSGKNRSGEIDLTRTGSATLTFGSDALEGLAFQNAPEEVAAMAYYIGEPEEASIKQAENFRISKETIALENGKYQNNLRITFDADAGYGQYTISDWVPSNTRLHSVKDGGGERWFYSTQEGQKLYFNLYHSAGDGGTWTITYFTQRAYDTVSVQDRTYLISSDTGETAFTERKIFE